MADRPICDHCDDLICDDDALPVSICGECAESLKNLTGAASRLVELLSDRGRRTSLGLDVTVAKRDVETALRRYD